MIVVDASVLIAHLDANDALHARADGALTEAADEPLASSVITLAEVLVGPAHRGRIEAARTALMQLGVEELSLGGDAPVRLATLRAETGLRLPDCCVLLAAQDTAAEMIITFDNALSSAAERLGIRVS